MGKPALWKAVDAQGKVHYTDNPARLPPELRKKAVEVSEDAGAVTRLEAQPEEKAATKESQAKAHVGLAERFPVPRAVEGGGAVAALVASVFAARSANPAVKLVAKVAVAGALGALAHVGYGALGMDPDTVRKQVQQSVDLHEKAAEARDKAIEEVAGEQKKRR